MDTLTLVGSNLTNWPHENAKITKDAVPFPSNVFSLYVFNHERWLYGALNLDQKHVRLSRLQTTQEHFLFPLEDCTLYIRKCKGFTEELKRLVQAYLPFSPGLMETIKVSLWDESDTFFEMNVTLIEKTEDDDFVVYYTHPSGEAMEVKGSDMGNDEVVNLLKALLENDNDFMRKIPEKKNTKGNQTENQFKDNMSDFSLIESNDQLSENISLF